MAVLAEFQASFRVLMMTSDDSNWFLFTTGDASNEGGGIETDKRQTDGRRSAHFDGGKSTDLLVPTN